MTDRQRPCFTEYLQEVRVIRHKDCSAADSAADSAFGGSCQTDHIAKENKEVHGAVSAVFAVKRYWLKDSHKARAKAQASNPSARGGAVAGMRVCVPRGALKSVL